MNKLLILTVIGVCTLTLAGCWATPDNPAADISTDTTDVTITANELAQSTVSWDNTAVDPTAYTMDQITAANTQANCLTVINGKVYDLTAWINQHPWGDRNILRICGIDGTSAFQGKHGGQQSPEATLEWFQVGLLAQ